MLFPMCSPDLEEAEDPGTGHVLAGAHRQEAHEGDLEVKISNISNISSLFGGQYF